MGYHCKDNWTGFLMIPIIVLKIQYQVIYNQSNLSFKTYFEEFIWHSLISEIIIVWWIKCVTWFIWKSFIFSTFVKLQGKHKISGILLWTFMQLLQTSMQSQDLLKLSFSNKWSRKGINILKCIFRHIVFIVHELKLWNIIFNKSSNKVEHVKLNVWGLFPVKSLDQICFLKEAVYLGHFYNQFHVIFLSLNSMKVIR